MFITTEPGITSGTHTSLRVIFGSGKSEALKTAIGMALAELEREAMQLGADGVIAVHVSISECVGGLGTLHHSAAAAGTAIKLQNL